MMCAFSLSLFDSHCYSRHTQSSHIVSKHERPGVAHWAFSRSRKTIYEPATDISDKFSWQACRSRAAGRDRLVAKRLMVTTTSFMDLGMVPSAPTPRTTNYTDHPRTSNPGTSSRWYFSHLVVSQPVRFASNGTVSSARRMRLRCRSIMVRSGRVPIERMSSGTMLMESGLSHELVRRSTVTITPCENSVKNLKIHFKTELWCQMNRWAFRAVGHAPNTWAMLHNSAPQFTRPI